MTSSKTTVHVSNDMGKTWTPATGTCVLVIQPGAGTVHNSAAYKQLEQNFTVSYVNTPTYNGGFKYPPGHGHMWSYDLQGPTRWEQDSLMGLSKSIGKDIVARKIVPHTIVTGSRGGQVVIPMIIKHFWRGSIVVINAGPLTTNSRIPKHVNPVFITCDRDYFSTNDVDYVRRQFKDLSDVDGVAVHLTNQSHMPRLHVDILASIVDALVHGKSISSSVIPQKHQLVRLTTNTTSPSTRAPLVTILGSRGGHDTVLLRPNPTKRRKFYHDRRAVVKDEKVSVEFDQTDEDGYAMVYIRSKNGTDGWIYCSNIKEFH